jgi:hypothetical protein
MRTGWNAMRTAAVWALATAAGMTVCWWGVRPVLDAVVPDRLVAFPASQPNTVTAPPPSPHRPAASATARPPSSPLSRLAPRSAAPSASPSAASLTLTVDGWTVLADGQYTRSFQMVGGSATVRANRGALELAFATPRAGFVMTIIPSATDRVVINFVGGLRISTLNASWLNDAPTATITEIP